MVARFFEQPVRVLYRTEAGWRRVLALGVRRSGHAYAVLIAYPRNGAEDTAWVPRSHVRADDPAAIGYDTVEAN